MLKMKGFTFQFVISFNLKVSLAQMYLHLLPTLSHCLYSYLVDFVNTTAIEILGHRVAILPLVNSVTFTSGEREN